jgi:hypothetical protein
LVRLAATKIEAWQQGRSVYPFDADILRNILRKPLSDVLPILYYPQDKVE